MPLTPDQALAKLQQGNRDFLAGKTRVSTLDGDRRLRIARSQSAHRSSWYSATNAAGR